MGTQYDTRADHEKTHKAGPNEEREFTNRIP